MANSNKHTAQPTDMSCVLSIDFGSFLVPAFLFFLLHSPSLPLLCSSFPSPLLSARAPLQSCPSLLSVGQRDTERENNLHFLSLYTQRAKDEKGPGEREHCGHNSKIASPSPPFGRYPFKKATHLQKTGTILTFPRLRRNKLQ